MVGLATARYALLGASPVDAASLLAQQLLMDARAMDLVEIPLPVPPAGLSSALDVLNACFEGFAVTAPYQEAVMPYMEELDEAASRCGRVDTVRVTRGGMVGAYTLNKAIDAALTEALVRVDGEDVLIAGAGAFACAAASLFLSQKCRVAVMARRPEAVEALRERLHAPDIECLPLDAPPKAYALLVNALPAGVHAVSARQVVLCDAVCDATITGAQTELIALAAREGIKTVEGMAIAFAQAKEAHHVWFGRLPERKKLRVLQQIFERGV